MPNDSKLYLCFEYCDYDLKKYMKSCQYKLSANCIKVRASPPPLVRTPVHLPQIACSLLTLCRPLLSPWQSFTYQMLNGLAWCHSHRIFHRCAAATSQPASQPFELPCRACAVSFRAAAPRRTSGSPPAPCVPWTVT